MRQIYKVRPSISPWKRNNITEIFLFSLLLPSVSDDTSVKSIYFSKSSSIHCKFPLHISTRSVPTQLYHRFQTIVIAPIVSKAIKRNFLTPAWEFVKSDLKRPKWCVRLDIDDGSVERYLYNCTPSWFLKGCSTLVDLSDLHSEKLGFQPFGPNSLHLLIMGFYFEEKVEADHSLG